MKITSIKKSRIIYSCMFIALGLSSPRLVLGSGYLSIGPYHSQKLGKTYMMTSLYVREKIYGAFSYQSWSGLGIGNQTYSSESGGGSIVTSQDLVYDFSSRISLFMGASYFYAERPNVNNTTEDFTIKSALRVKLW